MIRSYILWGQGIMTGNVWEAAGLLLAAVLIGFLLAGALAEILGWGINLGIVQRPF